MPKVSRCLSGECSCKSAKECKFLRCYNCDFPVGQDDKTLVDHWCETEKLEVCPDCGGPLNDHKIYGGLDARG